MAAIGVNIHEGGGSLAANTQIAQIMRTRNFTRARMDLFTGNSTVLPRDMITKIRAVGGKVTGLLLTPQQFDHTIYTGAALTTLENTAYNDAATLVNAYKDLVWDFEILNETTLRSECLAQVPQESGLLESAYTGQTSYISIGAALKGMARAVHDIGTSSGLPLRVVLGAVGRDFGFIDYMRTLGVVFDVVGWHNYPSVGTANIQSDPYYGTGGPLTRLGSYGKPVSVNEYHSGEIYNAGYENLSGGTWTENGWSGLALHGKEYYNQSQCNLESLMFYELWDETAKAAPENRFGLMYDLNTPKVSLYVATTIAGGTLSISERNALTSRSLFTTTEINAMQKARAVSPRRLGVGL